MLSRVSIGWKWLADHLNTIIDAVNVNTPLGSASITVDQSPTGTLLRVAEQNNQQTQPGQSTIVQASGKYQITLNGVNWQQVTVVDPSSCAQSQISVLVQQPGSSITFAAILQPVQ